VVDGRHHPAFETNRKRRSDMATDKEQAVIDAARKFAEFMEPNRQYCVAETSVDLLDAVKALDAPEDPQAQLVDQIREVTERWRQSKNLFASEPNAMREISCLMDVYDRERGPEREAWI
jgi:hypothetical protein